MSKKSAFMKEHPLRQSLSDDDLIRINQVLEKEVDQDFATAEELEAVYDIMYDYVAAESQTHSGITTLQ